MAVIRRICWCYIMIIIVVFALCKKDEKMMFEIERRLNQADTFPRDFTIDSKGEWKKMPSCSPNGCNTFNGFYSNDGNCRCACRYDASTFRMGPTARASTCIGNSKIRSDEGCTIHFRHDGMSRPLIPIDTSISDKRLIVTPSRITCNIFGSALYWDYGMWKPLVEDIFSLLNNTLKWKSSTKYSGRIIKQPMTCTSSSQTIKNCIMFKMAGKLAYDLNRPPTKAPTTSPTRSTGTLMTSTTKHPTTKPLTSTATTYQNTPIATTKQSTTSKQTTSTHDTNKTKPTSDQTTTTERNKHSTNEITTKATEKIPTGASEMPTTKATKQSTTETDVVPGKKGSHGASKDSDGGKNTLMITAIGATAAITCVVIICIFLWFVVKRRQNNRNNEAYSTDMTVITNSTGMNNSAAAAPTLKNPIYCEPTSKHHPKQLPVLGNPVYDKAIINNNKKGHQNTKNPLYKPSARNQSNYFDNKDDDEAYDNPGYQDLVIKGVEDKHANNADATYDNTYAEPEKPMYEALSKENDVRDSIYQPLVHNLQGTETSGTPEYLTLLNENTRPEEQEIPEYLTLVGDENNPNQPETGEYDYAFVDGQEKRTTLKAPSTRGAIMSPQKSQVCNGPSVNGPSVYDVLEDPNDKEPPVYDVLEDPNDKGPPVYNVLENPNDKGPPVYDVLENPNDKGPPVYDVLEGPDSGDDYLVPLEQSKK